MARVDPSQRAVECERLMNVVTASGTHRVALAKLRNRWICLGADRSVMTRADFDQRMDDITEVHDVMLAEIARLH